MLVETYRTEEEQVEALKNWWQENGRSTVLAIVVALGLGFGWQGWQVSKNEQIEKSSAVYQNLIETLDVYEEDGSNDSRTTAIYLANELKENYSDSTYAYYAALYLAKFAVEKRDLETAESELRWVLTRSPGFDIELITQQRLGRVLAARGDIKQSLSILSNTNTGKYASGYARAKGDIYLSVNKNAKALEAYQQAKTLDLDAGGTGQSYLDMKIKHLSPDPASTMSKEE